MTDTQFSALLAALPGLLAALGTMVVVIINGVRTRAKLDVIEKHTNGINERLVTAEKIVSKAEGKVEERSEVAERKRVEQL